MQCERCHQAIDTPFYAQDKATGGPVCGPCVGIAKVVIWAQWQKMMSKAGQQLIATCVIEGREPTEAEIDKVMNATA